MSIVHPNPLEVAAADAILEDSPTEVVMDDIAGSAAAIVEASDQVSEISRNVEELGDAAVSVENYVNRFLESVSVENWNPRIAHQYQIGMEAILNTCGVSVPPGVFCASFEAAGVSQTNEENREETKGKSEGVIKSLWRSFLEMLTRLWDNIQNFTAFLGKSTSGLRRAADNLKARVTKAKSDNLVSSTDKLSGVWASYLAEDIGGGNSINRPPVIALQKMAEKGIGFTTAWHASYLSAVTEMAEGNFASMDKGNSSMKDLERSLGELLNPALAKYNGQWPGGYTMLVQRKPDHLDRFEIKIKHEPDRGIEPKRLELTAINDIATELRTIADSIDTEMKAMMDGKQKIDAVKRKMETAIKSGEKPINGNVVKLASALMSDMMTGPRKVLPLVTGACFNAIKHCNESLHTYKAAGKAK